VPLLGRPISDSSKGKWLFIVRVARNMQITFGKKTEFPIVNLAVHTVTTRLYTVNQNWYANLSYV
jgi:hypothetical protein